VASGTATRYFFYTPELQLLATTVDDSDNVWGQRVSTMSAGLGMQRLFGYFGGQPVAELGPARTPDNAVALRVAGHATTLAATTLYYTFTDHLGTPLLQTDGSGAVVWRAEHEPYGNVWKMRAGARTDQPLRLPGQDLAMTWEGNEENYNVFRWYRAGWGRYSQADSFIQPSAREPNVYAYARENPIRFADDLGLFSVDGTCDLGCTGFGNVAGAVARACQAARKPACADLLRRFSFSNGPLDRCLKSRCANTGAPLIRCFKRTAACGEYFPFSGDINLYSGNAACPQQKGFGYGPTVFHEALHSCGLEVEPTTGGPYGRVFSKIMEVCTGYKE
jgi:RHS repeat-associated protein